MNYPRRQLEREQWISLNGPWQFEYDDADEHFDPGSITKWTRTIQVPFAPESKLSGIADTGFHPKCWYQKKFTVHKTSKRMLLHFGAVDYEAHVWLNGQFVGSHQGGHTPFYFDITEQLLDDGENTLCVCAKDDPFDLAKPRGKQDWQREPHSIWYPRTTGIWQTVWLEPLPETYIKRLVWTPHLERWEIGCEAFVEGPRSESLNLRVHLSVPERVLVDDRYKVIQHEVHRRIALSDPGIDDFRNELLWSPERPTLISALVELWDGNVLVDRVKSYTALRSVAIQRDRFILNGRPYYMRLALDQGYWAESLMTAPHAEALRRDVELAKAAGFNGVRKHQKIEDPEFLYWADVLGLLVWEEMPSSYRFTPEAVRRMTREWTEVIDRDTNHPCIVMWVPFNESWGVPDLAETSTHQDCVQALYHLTRTLDPTRPVIGNDGWESTATDILGIHDYDADPNRLAEKYRVTGSHVNDVLYRKRPGGRILTVEGYPHEGQPIMLTEFGGIACADENRDGASWGYSVCRDGEELKARYETLLHTVHRLDLFCGFCYTQLTDTFQEKNGLFRMDRTPKFSIRAMARATRGEGYNRGELLSTPQEKPVPLE